MTSREYRNQPLFLRNQFQSEGRYDMPVIKNHMIQLGNSVKLIGYDHISIENKETEKWVHFFLDDYKFESLYQNPEPRIQKLKRYAGVLSPGYSLYLETPRSIQIYNTFKNRWVGAYLQSKGIHVIPTVNWGDRESYDFCFDGIAEGSVVAVSTLGVRKEEAFFMEGYHEMIRRIHPAAVICYGKKFDGMYGRIIEIDYQETNHLNENSSEKSSRNSAGQEEPLSLNQVKASLEYKCLQREVAPFLFRPDKEEDLIELAGRKIRERRKDAETAVAHRKRIWYNGFAPYAGCRYKGLGFANDFFAKVPSTEASVERKLKEYLLDESHGKGGSKAKWLRKALGFTKRNWKELAQQIKVKEEELEPTEKTPYGQKYRQKIRIRGANGKEIDVYFIIIRNYDGVYRLVGMDMTLTNQR